MDLPANADVLNISSRDCEVADYILKVDPAANIINAEISQGMINEASRKRPYVKQVKIDTYSDLPFENKRFCRIVCLETLEHVANPVSFLNELNRVASENARMVLSCPPKTSEIPYQIFNFLFGGHGEGPHRFLRSLDVKELLNVSGWNLIHHTGTLLIPVGPAFLQNLGEWIISKCQKTFISELGIRQFYVCEKK